MPLVNVIIIALDPDSNGQYKSRLVEEYDSRQHVPNILTIYKIMNYQASGTSLIVILKTYINSFLIPF